MCAYSKRQRHWPAERQTFYGSNFLGEAERGDDDQIVPIGAAAMLSSKLVKGAILKVYPGAPHGMCSTLKDQVNAELLAFFKQSKQVAA